MKTILLPILFAVAVAASVATADQPELPFWLRQEALPPGVAPASFPASAVWKCEFDRELDGTLNADQSLELLLESANRRLTGRQRTQRDAENADRSLFAGEIIAGSPPLVTLRQDDPSGYTAVYTGRLAEGGRIVGSYADNRGTSGDWSLTLATERRLEPLASQPPDEKLFESVLGIYGKAIRGERYPLVNLRPPHRNLWTEEIKESVERVLSYEQVDYIGTAKLVIRASGDYVVDMPGAGVDFRINGQQVAAGAVSLEKGLYEVEIYTNHWGQPYLTYAEVAVRKQGEKEAVPFVNTASDIERFRSQKIADKPVVEVCKYSPNQIDTAGR